MIKSIRWHHGVLLLLTMLLMMTACKKETHFITDKQYRNQVHSDYENRMVLAERRADVLFAMLDTLSTEEREAMEFLYAYMPYSDLADYDGDYFLRQVRSAFAARDTFAWGRTVPEDVFRHFVLVYRVNNEDLDSARWIMQRELKERVRNLSMYDAALEVNHWCHEHVAYRAADSRTSAPLATMRTSLGRCGEESTFAVTALRSVGIPARQCYTPRWAHCDDNHAWVEVWIDGRWYFLGACEPDPELDMGWFSVPSTRTMMVHSNCFGPYRGSEEVNFQNSLYAKINMLPNYAPTEKVSITVYNANNQPVEGADVKFKLYNYSEYYPLATVKTNSKGVAQLTTGKGDLLIWATDGKQYAYAKLDVRQQQSLELYLTREAGTAYEETFEMVPPEAGKAKVTPTEVKVKTNAKRIAYEDSLRGAYVATFPTQQNYKELLKPNANLTDAQAWDLIHRSEGNYREVAFFLNNHFQQEEDIYLYEYLCSFSDKDLRDTPAEVFEAQLTFDSKTFPIDVYKKGLMPARISNELVRPWGRYLVEKFSEEGMGNANAEQVREWTLKNVAVDDTGNYYNCPISPIGVFELRRSDAHSRDIFYVAACRSLNIPAYLDNATNIIYVYFDNRWQTITFEEKEAEQPTAKLTLTYKGKTPTNPVYWIHFTLAKYEKGDFVTFDYENDDRLAHFPATLDLVPGYYMLSTGNRYPEGDVLSRVEFFEVKEGDQLTKEIMIRPLEAVNPRLQQGDKASINPSVELFDGVTLADYAGSKGMLFVFLGDYREPSKHLVKELQAISKEWKAWGGMTYLVAPTEAKALSWNLPNTDCFTAKATDKDPLRDQIIDALKLDFKGDYPLVALVNNKGEILFHNEGYRIGLAETILKMTK